MKIQSNQRKHERRCENQQKTGKNLGKRRDLWRSKEVSSSLMDPFFFFVPSIVSLENTPKSERLAEEKSLRTSIERSNRACLRNQSYAFYLTVMKLRILRLGPSICQIHKNPFKFCQNFYKILLAIFMRLKKIYMVNNLMIL